MLEAEHPDVKIIGFDHNKDHVVEWATGLYADPEAAKYFAGVGVHWYGGLNTGALPGLDPGTSGWPPCSSAHPPCSSAHPEVRGS